MTPLICSTAKKKSDTTRLDVWHIVLFECYIFWLSQTFHNIFVFRFFSFPFFLFYFISFHFLCRAAQLDILIYLCSLSSSFTLCTHNITQFPFRNGGFLEVGSRANRKLFKFSGWIISCLWSSLRILGSKVHISPQFPRVIEYIKAVW